MAQVLRMTFVNEGGGKVSLNFKNPKTGLTGAEVKTAMDAVIAKNIFESAGGDLISADSALIIDTTDTALTLV
ncbi:MAG: DUF2922 domain-containing protein [Candidatus Atribacteria bacterium]|nr:DUF2922 domain-containing protein [Candidatus Atribacteria bacterium]